MKSKRSPERDAVLARGRTIVAKQTLTHIAARDKATRQRSAGNKFRRLHKPGAHWYEIKAYFDPANAQVTPVEDSGYMLGVLEDFVVVEVPAAMPAENVERIGKALAEMGVKVLVVREGVKFLKLCACGSEQEQRLNDILEKRKHEAGETAASDTDEAPGHSAGS